MIFIRYKIDNFDPARFNDIHALLYAGAELLYAARVSGKEHPQQMCRNIFNIT